MKNLLTRTLAGLVYVGVIVAALLLAPIWFLLLLLLMAVGAMLEYQRMTPCEGRGQTARLWDVIAVLVIITVCFTTASGASPLMLAAIPAVVLARLAGQLYSHCPAPVLSVGSSLASYLYIGGALGSLPFIYDCYGSRLMVLLIFILIWLNDTGAFIVGSLIGRRKLFERLSPKKSWEGFFGGLLFDLLAAWGAWAWLPGWLDGLSLPAAFGLGAVVCVFATWGDLFESMLKRASGLKDSGHIIPGHGGVLDRIDSLLFVAPAVLLYLMILAAGA